MQIPAQSFFTIGDYLAIGQIVFSAGFAWAILRNRSNGKNEGSSNNGNGSYNKYGERIATVEGTQNILMKLIGAMDTRMDSLEADIREIRKQGTS